MIIYLSDNCYEYLSSKASSRKICKFIEWLSLQKYKDTRPEYFLESDDIRRKNKLNILWYEPVSNRYAKNISLNLDTLARFMAISLRFEIFKQVDTPVFYYQTPVQLTSYVLEAIAQGNLTPLNALPKFEPKRNRFKKIMDLEF